MDGKLLPTGMEHPVTTHNSLMSPRSPFARFLISASAIQVHLLCGTLIVVLSIDLRAGNAKPDYKWGLLFTILVYPLLLGLLWWRERLEGRAAVEHVIESLTEPERLRRKRQWGRLGASAFLVAVATGLVISGNRGLLINAFPAQYLGYILYAFVALGAMGVNVWYGGPLDPRFDPPPQDE